VSGAISRVIQIVNNVSASAKGRRGEERRGERRITTSWGSSAFTRRRCGPEGSSSNSGDTHDKYYWVVTVSGTDEMALE
jgi:hypothetical protein